jgi:hypothetical protein
MAQTTTENLQTQTAKPHIMAQTTTTEDLQTQTAKPAIMAQTTTEDLQTQDAKPAPDFVDVKKDGSDTTTLNMNQQTEDVPPSPRDFNSPFSRRHTRLHVDDYFVGSTLQPGSGMQADLNMTGRPNGHPETFKMANIYADARQCLPRNDTPPHICRRMVNPNYLSLPLCP